MFLCVLAIFCFYQITAAQSGRRVKKNDASTEQKPATESKPTETKNETQKNETPVVISSLTIVGEVQVESGYYRSNYIDAAFKECIRILKSSKSLSEITKGSGKTSYTAAKELAEKETDTYILWIGFAAKDDAYGGMYIDSVQYAVLMPKTAKVLTRGQIEPKQVGVLDSGGVLNIPDIRKNPSDLTQMKDAARQIAGILLRGGWLK